MSLFFWIIFWPGVIALLWQFDRAKATVIIDGKEELRATKIFAFIAFLPIILWAGLRPKEGYVDTNAYVYVFKDIPTAVSSLKDYLGSHPKDQGYTLLVWLIKVVFGDASYTPYLFIIALIQGLLLIYFFQKYSIDFAFSFFMFIVMGDYFAWMMNGMRQFLAVMLILAGTPWMLKKRMIRVTLLILLASTIHLSALIMLPISLIATGKPWNWKTLLLILLAVFFLFFTGRFTNLLESALENTQYADNMAEWLQESQTGVNPFRVMVYSVPAVISFFQRDRIWAANDPKLDFFTNMSIVTAALFGIGMVTSGIMIGRLPIYTAFYNYLLLPYEFEMILNKRTEKLVKTTAVVFYLIYYYYMMHITYHRF